MWGRLLCLSLMALNLATAALAQAPPAPPVEEELFLEVELNGEPTGLILRFTRGTTTGLRSSVQNLRDLELDPRLFGVEGRDQFDLDDIRGLSYSYDATRQSIALRVADTLRAPVALSGRSVRVAGPAAVTPGLVLTYDAFGRLDRERGVSVAHELRYFNDSGVFNSTGVYNAGATGTGPRFIRLDTAWVRSDPVTLETWQVGDLISSSLPWSRSLRMGGVQWRKSFDLRPDLLTFPVATLSGSAVVPSAVSLYVNGVRQVETAVPSGPFVINQVAGINGAGQATLVTRDTAGRAVTTTVPLYVDTRLLAAGLTDYSIELGVLRRDYTTRSFGYARAPAASASLRHGVSDSLTVEGHGEVGREVVNGGAGAMLRLGQAGVVRASLAASGGRRNASGSGRGVQAGLGYQYLSGRFSIDAETLRASGGYSDLATADSGAGARANDRINVNLALWPGHSLGASLVSLRAPSLPPARIAALSYAATLGAGFYLSVSAFRDLRDAAARGLFFSLSASFGDRIAANASAGRQNGVRSRIVTVGRSADYAGGFGWGLQSLESNGAPLRQGQLTYLGGYGQVGALVQQNGDNRSTSLSAAGSLVVMDGGVHAARQVGAGFALVSTDGVGGVPVLQENRVIGRTGAGGYLLVPNLNPYLINQVGIDTSALPLDARIAATRREVVPARQSGVLARFPVETYAAASVIVHGADGKPVAAGARVLHVESGASTLVGFDGVAFIDNLAPQNHLRLTVDGVPCVVEFAYEAAKGPALPTLGPFICRGVQ
ncbi:outer membrane usher protein [Duganella sp. CF517]|nr:outer membrane usher protein [Duganella sp. CF517]